MQSRVIGSVSSTKVSDGPYVVTDAYARIYDFFETSPLFPSEPLIVPTPSADEKRVTAGPAQPER
jgi:hypothetical protein